VSIVGSSGAGKSTFLHIAGTLDSADSGTIEINGELITGLKGNELSAFRNRHIGFIFQFHHLLPEFTALENTCIPAWIKGENNARANKRAIELLELLNLKDRLYNKPRVAVARALINNPSIVFADEPTGNLDSIHARELHQLFFTLRKELNQTFLIVTHNEELADLSDRKLVMKDGVIMYDDHTAR
jgi:lipoprotein-releasing system ATP-binding protein